MRFASSPNRRVGAGTKPPTSPSDMKVRCFVVLSVARFNCIHGSVLLCAHNSVLGLFCPPLFCSENFCQDLTISHVNDITRASMSCLFCALAMTVRLTKRFAERIVLRQNLFVALIAACTCSAMDLSQQ